MILDRIGMDAVIQLGNLSVEIPVKGQTAILISFQPLIVLDDV